VVRIRRSVITGAGSSLSGAAGHGERQAAAVVEAPFEPPGIDAGHPVLAELRHRLAEDRRRLAVDVLVRLDVRRVATSADLDRLVDELPGRADRHSREEVLDAFRVETDAAVAHQHPDAPGDVRAVNAVRRQRQLETVLAERIVRRAARDEGPRIAALGDVLLANRLRDVPLWIDGLAVHLEAAARRL